MKKIILTIYFCIFSFLLFAQDNYYVEENKYLTAKTVFKYGLDKIANKSTITTNSNINLGSFKIDDKKEEIYFSFDSFYNLNVWLAKRHLDEFHYDKIVYACLFWYNGKNNTWTGGIFNKVYLTTSGTISLAPIYNREYNWPAFNKKFTNLMKFKFCLYDPEYNQFSTIIYNFDIYK